MVLHVEVNLSNLPRLPAERLEQICTEVTMLELIEIPNNEKITRTLKNPTVRERKIGVFYDPGKNEFDYAVVDYAYDRDENSEEKIVRIGGAGYSSEDLK